MPGMMSDTAMTKLRALSGTAFDRAFLTKMTTHHQGAIRMAQTEEQNGGDPAVKRPGGGPGR
jgi:uncharacterized protein (DUF305 family)